MPIELVAAPPEYNELGRVYSLLTAKFIHSLGSAKVNSFARSIIIKIQVNSFARLGESQFIRSSPKNLVYFIIKIQRIEQGIEQWIE